MRIKEDALESNWIPDNTAVFLATMWKVYQGFFQDGFSVSHLAYSSDIRWSFTIQEFTWPNLAQLPYKITQLLYPAEASLMCMHNSFHLLNILMTWLSKFQSTQWLLMV